MSFSTPFKVALNFLLQKAGYEQLGVFYGYLRGSGWTRSLRTKKPVDRSNLPLPWYSYPFIHFLEQKLETGLLGRLRVFEFGSGHSTLWWSQRAHEVVSVEDNKDWYLYVQNAKPNNVSYRLAQGENDYVGCLLREPDFFDVIVIDGSHRERCLANAAAKLTAGGVLIIDNSDWPALSHSLAQLERQAFRRLEFYGLGPMNGHPWGTSVMYRDNNVFGI